MAVQNQDRLRRREEERRRANAEGLDALAAPRATVPVTVAATPQQRTATRRTAEVPGMQAQLAQDANTLRSVGMAGLDVATGGVGRRAIANTTFDDRLPRQDVRDRMAIEQARGRIMNDPARGVAADAFGQDVSDRTYAAGFGGLATPQSGVVTAPPGVPTVPVDLTAPATPTTAATPAPAAPTVTRDFDAEVARVAANTPRQGNVPTAIPRGVFDQRTNVPSPQTNGINFGFGGDGETATQYLERMRQQDATDQIALLQRQRAARAGTITDSSSIGDIVATRAQLAVMDREIEERGTMNESAQARAAEERLAVMERAGGLEAAQLELQGDTAAAQATRDAATIGADGRVQAAAVTADGKLQVNQGTQQNQMSQAQLNAARLELANKYYEAGRPDLAQQVLAGQMQPKEQLLIDPITGQPIGAFTPGSGIDGLERFN